MDRKGEKQMVRQPVVAGRFYPLQKKELKQQIHGYFDKLEKDKEIAIDVKTHQVKALMVPHAGYVFSGYCAASAYSLLGTNCSIQTVFLIGTSHTARYRGISVYNGKSYATPLGNVNINTQIVEELLQSSLFIFNQEVHENEHSLEVQLPFLQYLWNCDFNIVPMLVGTNSFKQLNDIAEVLGKYKKQHNLFIFSTDLSHYPSYETACKTDKATIDVLIKGNKDKFKQYIESIEYQSFENLSTVMCGWTSVYLMLSVFENDKNIVYQPILYQNSGDNNIYGDKERVVGYQSLVVYNKEINSALLTPNEQETLLQISHSAINKYLNMANNITAVPTESFTETLQKHFGVFVSVYCHNALRGCIGSLKGLNPLHEMVQELAISAAFSDSRFTPIQTTELDQVKLEISVLTPMLPVKNIDNIVLGKHGVYMQKGLHTGTYLPQVATKTGWSVVELLQHCAHDKMGCDWDDWKTAEIFTYETFIIREK